MSKISEDVRYTIFARLINGDAAKEVAADADVSYATVIKMRRELDAAKEVDAVHELLDMDAVMRTEVMKEARSHMPNVLLEEADLALANISGNVAGLELLSIDMQKTACALSNKIRKMALGADHASEIETLASALCSLQVAFFNNNTTQVNVQNNYGTEGGNKYGGMLDDKPKDY